MKRIRPRLLTAAIMLRVTRFAVRATTGVSPLGAQERPTWSWLERPVSSPQPCPPRPGATPAGAGAGRGRAPTAGAPRAPPPGTRSARGRRPAPTRPAHAAAALEGAAGARRASARSGTAPSGRAWPGSGVTAGGTSVMLDCRARPTRFDNGYLPLSAGDKGVSVTAEKGRRSEGGRRKIGRAKGKGNIPEM